MLSIYCVVWTLNKIIDYNDWLRIIYFLGTFIFWLNLTQILSLGIFLFHFFLIFLILTDQYY